MRGFDWEALFVLIVGLVVMFILMLGAERAVGALPKETFCLRVAASVQEVMELRGPERVKYLSDLKEQEPELARHVIPATGAATQAWIRGATITDIMGGVFIACTRQVKDV